MKEEPKGQRIEVNLALRCPACREGNLEPTEEDPRMVCPNCGYATPPNEGELKTIESERLQCNRPCENLSGRHVGGSNEVRSLDRSRRCLEGHTGV